MKIVTANVNGIRAAGRKGFFDWVAKTQAYVVCIQETKAQVDQLTDALYHPEGYHCFYHDAQKKGYSGVALYCQHKPDEVVVGMGNDEFDSEGRYIEAKFWQFKRHFPLYAIRFIERRAPAIKISLHGPYDGEARGDEGIWQGLHCVWRLEYRP